MNLSVAVRLHKDRDEIRGFCSRFEKIYLYGAGQVPKKMLRYLQEENIEIAGGVGHAEERGSRDF